MEGLEIRHLTVEDVNIPPFNRDSSIPIPLLLLQGQQKHHVFHYYFTGWPDFSVVDRDKLLDLIETVAKHGERSSSKKLINTSKPMVIHCR